MWQRRVPLSAEGSEHGLWIENIVVLCMSILSSLGAGWIVLSYIVSMILSDLIAAMLMVEQLFKEARAFRHKLILYVMAIT
jgi:hypothetical protein